MKLEKYVAKRDFKKTSEPKAGKSSDRGKLAFVVQKHAASRLHYDFRLEMEGVLKSWAVPKGPSLDPTVKRLAMMVEDHPFDYLHFEGTIPKGEYGGGTVIVWDKGTYEPIEPIKGKKASEKHLLEQLELGSVKVILHGEKLQGEFALVKTRGMGDNAWLMIKHRDEKSSGKDVTKQDKSVLSGKTIAGVAKTVENIWKDGREQKNNTSTTTRKKKAPETASQKKSRKDTGEGDEVKTLPKSVRVAKKATGITRGPKRKPLFDGKDETQVHTIAGHELKFTNLSKLYWPVDKITKRDMFNYYYQVAPYILPYLEDRPLSLNRFPGGINSQSFYQKDIRGKAPAWITKRFPYTSSDGEVKEYLVGDNEAVLLWMASLGCIEMNPWFSRAQSPDHPDYCVIDLDPDKNTFDQVIEVALEVKNVFDAMGVPCYCKTSGSTGMHIYVPLGAKYSYEQSQMFARIVVGMVHERLPDFTSIERTISKRKGKMYLDFLQNRPGATIACPYSLRPKNGATVSMPLHWDELKPGLKMSDFTIRNAIERVRAEGDLFKGVLAKGIDLAKTLRKAEALI